MRMKAVLRKVELIKSIERQCLLLDIHNDALNANPKKDMHFLNRNICEIRNNLSILLAESEGLGLDVSKDIDISKITGTIEYKNWIEPRIMGEVFPVTDIRVALSMKDIEENISHCIDLPLRKAMLVLIEKGWITDYSSGNYNDASGNRFNMFVDRKNVAFIRFAKDKLKVEDKKHLLKGNFGEYMLYTEIDLFTPVEEVENKLLDMAINLPFPSYIKSKEFER